MTVTPNALLAVNSQYDLRLTNGIKDATGNTFNWYDVSLYTTFAANTTAPTVVAVNPPASIAGVGICWKSLITELRNHRKRPL